MVNQPTGTVTFLFTDIEGSTRLWQEHPDAMQPALARHDELLRTAIAAHGGVTVKSTGDGAHAAFANASDAIDAAVAAQLAFNTELWPLPEPLRIRMGIHSGPAELRDGDYYGTAVNRAARIMSVAHGGQVVASLATTELVRDGSVELVDLGQHRLRDLGRPEHVFQVVHPALWREFPPLASLDAFGGNLPEQLTAFVGRETELEGVIELAREARLVTLTGPGGVGKTRLVLQAAAVEIGRYEDGAWFVDLAPVADPERISATVTRAMGIPEPRQGTVEDALLAALQRRHALLILDNCEHLVDAASGLVERIARSCPQMTVLATSREPLGVSGEATFPVKPLAVPDAGDDEVARLLMSDAVQLFVERARSARHGFELTPENAGQVGELCRRLDGIPLAIELAAARVQSMSVVDIVARLNERFRLLGHSRRSGLARHQTLRAALDWSYGLLDSDEQRVFARLSVFAGSFGLDAAEAIVSDTTIDAFDVLELVSALVAKSIVIADDTQGSIRYRLLETLRDYGAERLTDSGEAEALLRNHSAFYLALVERVSPDLQRSDALAATRMIGADYDNLRAALVYCEDSGDAATLVRLTKALGLYWEQRNANREGSEWIAVALRMDPEMPDALRAELEGHAGQMALQLGRWDEARRMLRASLTSSDADDGVPFPHALHGLALDALEMNRPDEARGYAQAMLAAARAKDSAYWESFALGALSLMHTFSGDDEAGIAIADQAIEGARRLRNPYMETLALQNAGIARWRRDPSTAIGLFDQVIALSRSDEVDGHMQRMQSHFFRALARLRLGDDRSGAADLRIALQGAQTAGVTYAKAEFLSAVPGVLGRQRESAAAIAILSMLEQLRADGVVAGAPDERQVLSRMRERLLSTTEPAEFQMAWDQGRRMTLDDGVALAITELDRLERSSADAAAEAKD
jgi:predicted ATPase/class 3 adenylate cyclase